ncbi:SCO-spondin-like [Mya arenaria]|uniref:SCO-spondin-like n=1 Tax=Mya arenaria TaxID=6604 RepID=UPI0022E896C8|nr:SCO-spondin-like [Mya arenaria]XP_052793993.1 SCO-spondin-like [Mya arenaria]
MGWKPKQLTLCVLCLLITRTCGDSMMDMPFLEDVGGGGFQGPSPLNLFNTYNFGGARTISDIFANRPPNASLPKFNRPPMTANAFNTLPQLPIRMVSFPTNKSLIGPAMVPGGDGRAYRGFVAVPPGSPLEFLKTPTWALQKSPTAPSALGVAIKGTVMGMAPNGGPQTDPVHQLSSNHLFVPVPVGQSGPIKGDAPPTKPVADILIVIDASKNMGHIDEKGVVVWNPSIVDFLNKFIATTPMGPEGNRIGIVSVSFGIDDMIALTFDKESLVRSLGELRPLFRGGCTEKGIRTASSLFYQYGRQTAVKRIVLLTDEASTCPYRNMAEILYARKCGIDIIHVGFGTTKNISGPIDEAHRSQWMVQGMQMLPDIVHPVAKRAYIAPIHGGWSTWSDWNRCSADAGCSIGYQMHFRLCDNPKPMFGGRNCEGFAAETRMCHMRPCIDLYTGHWTRWTEFTRCSSPCGLGTQSRQRTCITIDGYPSANCKGPYVERVDCLVRECPRDGEWSVWSTYSRCSQSCGSGIQMRARQCDAPSPANGGKPCAGPAVEENICDTGLPCPIHGEFGPWSEYGICEGNCGLGKAWRFRKCDGPAPQYGGNPCLGPLEMFKPCDTGIPCAIHGQWGDWSPYSFCTATCGVGIKTRVRQCDNPPPQFGGLLCDGPDFEEIKCETEVPCPINGQWSIWSEYQSCSTQCGIGFTQRKRICNNPSPMYGGLECIGAAVEERECDTKVICPVDGNWGPWNAFSKCSVDCGVGIMSRERSCNNPSPMNGGSFCIGLSIEQRECVAEKKCVVHGYWSNWLPWGDCSAACGTGFRQRHRLCNNPVPLNGGLSCDGSPIQEDECDTRVPCPIDGGWSKWSEPLPCSVSCGIGTTKRTRLCNSPEPMFGGTGCFGPDTEVFECDSHVPCSVHGGWSPWSDWSICDGKCGVSIKRRSRACDNPRPAFGGNLCLGMALEEIQCDTGIPCPINGGWSEWLDWSPCSENCGYGTSFRKRFCDAPVPQFGGLACDGPDIQELKCDTKKPCPVDGNWTPWTDLSSCSVSCGMGVMQRERSCDNPRPKYGGLMCSGYGLEELPCDTLISCPIDGNWGPWEPYSECSAQCGSGLKVRIRNCNSPIPQYGGMPCEGVAHEEVPCDTGKFCAQDGAWSPWSEYTPCNVNCGVGIISRVRKCDNPPQLYGGKPCVGFDFEESTCDTGVFCPVDGNWGPWSEYTPCSVDCGLGTQIRSRECNNPPPKYGGGFCPGNPLEKIECDMGVLCPIDGGWSEWSMFGECDATCGMGMQRKVRVCTNPLPMFGGKDCSGESFIERPCDTYNPCPMDGGYTEWSSWTACSVDCGIGMSQRKRDCSNPPPRYGGLPCIGKSTEIIDCDTGIHCPIHGGWSDWSQYGECSVPCGIGIAQRSRVCNNPIPQYGGNLCIGPDTDGVECDTKTHCPIDGGFSPWSQWSVCKADCGEGLQIRERYCNSPDPQFGGVPCKGITIEERSCDTGVFCQRPGEWGNWSPFTKCSHECGVGVIERTRLCDNPPPMYGGKYCIGPDLDSQPCDTGIYCPIDGFWSMWSPWTSCSVSCSVGVQVRERHCDNPPAQHGGLPCKGEPLQEKICNSNAHCPVHGQWSFWSDWLPCDVECGKGMHSRTRTCTNPHTQYGGLPCEGPDVDTTVCDTGRPCPIPGNWSPWNMWSMCTATCGSGLQQRIRECSNPAPMNDGAMCPGFNEEIRECKADIACHIHGNWSPWTQWTPCSETCGLGFQGRTRSCTNPAPQFGGTFCEGIDTEKSECATGVPCPIDGNWSPWTEYGACDVPCGIGSHVRTRVCNNPPQAYGGQICVGEAMEIGSCDTGIFCPINGGWSLWSSFGVCNGVCGYGFQERKRTCDNPKPMYGGIICDGRDIDVLECDTEVPCPVDGGWSTWYKWSPCSSKCGLGKHERHRECNSPKALYGGKPCAGFSKEIGDCDSGVHCPVDGGWTHWSPPTECSASCGKGLQTMYRECSDPKPQYNGRLCQGADKDIIECDTGIPCPQNGNWGPWGKFETCNVKCGVGLHMRTRVCDNPPPMNGGLDCVGTNMQESKCHTNIECTVNGGWSFWSPWSDCKAKCGLGQQIRVRECNSPSPINGGVLCDGPDSEVKECDTGHPCTIPGGWAPWGEWQICDASCGSGVQSRFRDCSAPAPQYGGPPCAGQPAESRECITGIPCPIDGHWTVWTVWTSCSDTCGMGVRKRERFCDDPPPQFGGQPCIGIFVDTEKCDAGVPCAIPGSWSHWAPWQHCSADCNVGVQIRKRFCDNPAPQFDGPECPGPSEEIRDCDTGVKCPEPGNWGFWTSWSKCSVECGAGIQNRYRKCDNPTPINGGMPCKGFAEEVKECDTKIMCPINGNWSPWSTFGECSVICGIGVQSRRRICDNPPNQFGGFPCKGHEEETVSCDTGMNCPIDGQWGPWFAWSKCSQTCGIGEIERRRECTNPKPQYGGKTCIGPDMDIGQCDTNIPCAINGNWGPWSDFTKCSSMCGIGNQQRQRVCNNPPPQFGGMLCDGMKSQTEITDCDTGIPCKIDGNWGIWGKWENCPVKCGVGITIRKRMCDSPPPKFGGMPCEGFDFEEQKCDTMKACVQHGGWTFWSQWTKCSASCGLGIMTRYRDCDSPKPLNGGNLCQGLASETMECDMGVPCPVHGNWGPWYEWSKCSVNCGVGAKERTRDCNNPAPQFGGFPCKGKMTDVVECDTHTPCPINGGWTLWSPWAGCSATCGVGMKGRTRECSYPPPAFGGFPCEGPNEELLACDSGVQCPIHGGWSTWSDSSTCVGKCGFGEQKRIRVCDSPLPQYGGMECEGPAVEIVKCDTGRPCSIPGGWTFWSEWTQCDAKCGVGISERWRRCTNPPPQNGGEDCTGPHLEIVDCDTGVPCAVDGNWSPWSDWSKCSEECGVGQQIRFRTCSNPRPSLGGKLCSGMPEESRECKSGKHCSINGNWAPWSDWTMCDKKCGKGYQERFRTCSDPKPMYGGRICFGIPKEQRTCDSGVNCPIPGEWSPWSLWGLCSAKCGKGFQSRVRTCTNPKPQFGGPPCEGFAEERRDCDDSLYCKIDGAWGSWLHWEKCDAKCGLGMKRRFRMCDSPMPQNGGAPCFGYDAEELSCDTGISCDRIGGMGHWMAWSKCSVSCDNGVQIRERLCNNPPPSSPDLGCLGTAIDERPCSLQVNCPVNGGWSPWDPYGKCIADCSQGPQNAVGFKTRTRYCSNPEPAFGGQKCIGVSEQAVRCYDFPPCFKPDWSLWTKWSMCSAKCGPGVQERTRYCVDRTDGQPDNNCIGDVREVVQCQIVSCPTSPLNCSTECKWDNGIGYASYPGECSLFVQCDSLYGTPKIQKCPWGLLWSLEMLQCVFPHQSECNACADRPGHLHAYQISCRGYWDCTQLVPVPKCCLPGERFNPFTFACELDVKGQCNDECNPSDKALEPTVCEFKESSLGGKWYEQKIGSVWTPRPCGDGTIYSHENCGCIYFYDGISQKDTVCEPDLLLTFDTLRKDIKRNVGLRVENVTYLGDGTAHFDGTAAINDNIFSNAEWGTDVYMYIKFKPEGKGQKQGLLHNSGCGPSDIGPSVFVGIDRDHELYGAGNMNMKFAAVPIKTEFEYDFVNITVPDGEMIEAWFKFSHGVFEAQVNGQTIRLDIPDATSIARRHGALNIAGNLCQIGTEAYGPFLGIVDEVRVYKCKPPQFSDPTNPPIKPKMPPVKMLPKPLPKRTHRFQPAPFPI